MSDRTPSRSHLDAVFDNVNSMQNISYKLDRLASSFTVVGNDKVAIQLMDIADEIVASSMRLRETFIDMQATHLDEAHKSTANILTAMIGGIEIGKGK